MPIRWVGKTRWVIWMGIRDCNADAEHKAFKKYNEIREDMPPHEMASPSPNQFYAAGYYYGYLHLTPRMGTTDKRCIEAWELGYADGEGDRDDLTAK